ncbi:cytochrome C biogenesis protein [Methylosinus sp. R-45379]|uniref:cytochrome c-type biogenesis protein n=1 Tax=Methylosinus sp. LW3 TaxID=107635 RepID=UPI000466B734|nr:cytochrome c-type biogenesis protein [Methylosinus sp. LW3]OAI31275.1 cytochrome C biogenesis protein [Methylosinus sp. R-45379]
MAHIVSAWLLSVALLAPALAVEPSEKLADPKLEARARAIASELRCLVCQNQSIDDSDAPLAKDLRVIVRERLKDGASDAEVRDYVVARYGDFVLLRPPVKRETLLLWAAPALALIGGVWAIFAAVRRGRRRIDPAMLTAEERAQLQALGVEPPPSPADAGQGSGKGDAQPS